MPALSFFMFRDKIENGTKRQTIRLARKRPIKVGDKLYLYWKMRTKECRPILVKGQEDTLICSFMLRLPWLFILAQSEIFALWDGFESEEAFLNFFEQHYHPKPEALFDIVRW